VLFGGERLDDEQRSGGRFRSGFWLNERQTIGIEGSVFFLGPDTIDFVAASLGSPNLSRPFVNAVTGRQDAELVAFPAVLNGTVGVSSSSTFWGADVYGRGNLCCGCNYRLDALLGYRFLRLRDRLSIFEDLQASATDDILVPLGTQLAIRDEFDTENQFHGAQLGVIAEYRQGMLFVEGSAKLALGASRQQVDINGSTRTSLPGLAPVNHTGGLLALPTNIGHYGQTEFAVVPEVGVNIGMQLGRLRGFVGYTLLYWSDVARAGNQIDLTVNPTQLPPGVLVGPARPAFAFTTSDYWAQGINFGVEWRY
jgi:hypothetical protein